MGRSRPLGRAWSGLSFYSTSTRELLGTYDDVSAWKTEMRPDGKQLAVSAQEEQGSGRPFPNPSVRLLDVATMKDAPAQLGGTPESVWPAAVHYSADGRFLAATFDNSRTSWCGTWRRRKQPVQHVTACLIQLRRPP